MNCHLCVHACSALCNIICHVRIVVACFGVIGATLGVLWHHWRTQCRES